MLYLASQSPRRAQLLEQLGLRFGVLEVEVIERREAGEAALDYGRRVAREKAGAGLLRVMSSAGATVLAADTEVVLDDEVFGKPVDAVDAARMLAQLAGRTHRVVSAVCVLSGAREAQIVQVSEVTFAALTAAQIANYVATHEPLGKAGGYAIQGAAAAFIEHLSGSYSGVMGLPLFETAQLLRDFGVLPCISQTSL